MLDPGQKNKIQGEGPWPSTWKRQRPPRNSDQRKRKAHEKGMQVFRKPIGSPVTLGKLPKQKTTGIKLGSAKIAEFLAKHGASPFTTHGRPQTSLPALKSQVQGAQPGMLNKTLTAGSGSSMPSLSGASLKPPAMKATPRPATT